jgi:hypothetical protein
MEEDHMKTAKGVEVADDSVPALDEILRIILIIQITDSSL